MEIENIVNVEIDAKHNLKMYLPYKEEDYIQRTIWRTKKPYEFEMLKDVLKKLSMGIQGGIFRLWNEYWKSFFIYSGKWLSCYCF